MNKHTSDIVIDTMKGWLDGEPVWPFAKIIEAWGPDFKHWRLSWSRDDLSDMETYAKRIVDRFRLRDQWIEQFGFAIPCAELLDELAKATHVIEVGAGTGYMTRLMRHRGIDVIGSDPCVRHYSFTPGKHDESQVGAPANTMVRRYPNSTVFCSWPSYSETWFRQMLKAMSIGQRLVVIREDACADYSAWEYLDACFESETTIDIPTFDGMNDYVDVRIKKRQTPAA